MHHSRYAFLAITLALRTLCPPFLFQDRQLRAGLGLVSAVEAVLAGSPDSVWGLLNLVRLVCGPQALQGAGGRSGSVGRVRGADR